MWLEKLKSLPHLEQINSLFSLRVIFWSSVVHTFGNYWCPVWAALTACEDSKPLRCKAGLYIKSDFCSCFLLLFPIPSFLHWVSWNDKAQNRRQMLRIAIDPLCLWKRQNLHDKSACGVSFTLQPIIVYSVCILCIQPLQQSYVVITCNNILYWNVVNSFKETSTLLRCGRVPLLPLLMNHVRVWTAKRQLSRVCKKKKRERS